MSLVPAARNLPYKWIVPAARNLPYWYSTMRRMLAYSRTGRMPMRRGTAASKIQRWYRSRRVATAKRTAMKNFRNKGYYQTAKSRPATKYGKRLKDPTPRQQSQLAGDQPTFATYTSIKLATLTYRSIIHPTPAGGQTFDFLGERHGQNIMLKGIKINRRFFSFPASEGTGILQPFMMHYAMVQFKDADVDPNTWAQQLKENFFRTYGEIYDRTRDFDNNTSSTVWTNYHNELPMNPDGNFNIIFHWRKRMEQKPTSTIDRNQRPHTFEWNIKRYVRLNKVIHYTNLQSLQPTHPILEVFWYQCMNGIAYPPVSDGEFVGTNVLNVTYYEDEKP